MKILYIEKSVISRLGETLAEAGHALTSIKDEKAALAALGGNRFQLVMLSAAGGDESIITTIKALRIGEDSRQVNIIVFAYDAQDDYLVRALNSGADVAMRTPCALPWIVAQIRAAQRVVPSVGDGAAVETSDDASLSPLDRLKESSTWKHSRDRIREVTGKFLTMDVKTDEVESLQEPIDIACSIRLSNVEQQLEVHVALGTGAVSGKSLAIHLFGPEGVDLIPDMLSELANIVMGTLKTSLSGEALAFAGGLPQTIDQSELLRPSTTYTHQMAFALRMGNAAIRVQLGAKSKANLFLVPASLREGMILAKDVFNARGLLIVQKGTRLSINMIEKIAGLVPIKSLMEVVAA